MRRPRPVSPRGSSPARDKGEISAEYSDEELEILAWAIMGANVFLGLALRSLGKRRSEAGRRSDEPDAALGARQVNAEAGSDRRRHDTATAISSSRRPAASLSRLSGARRQAASAVPSRPDPKRARLR